MAYATVQDIQDRYEKPLGDDPDFITVLETRLNDVELMLRSRIANFDARVAADPYYRQTVVKVEADAVLRLLRNFEGIRQEAEGNYSYALSAAVASGYLWIMDQEWQELGVSSKGGVFTLTPVVRSPYPRGACGGERW